MSPFLPEFTVRDNEQQAFFRYLGLVSCCQSLAEDFTRWPRRQRFTMIESRFTEGQHPLPRYQYNDNEMTHRGMWILLLILAASVTACTPLTGGSGEDSSRGSDEPPAVGEFTPDVVPRLSEGAPELFKAATIAEAELETGIKVWIPSRLPPGFELSSEIFYMPQNQPLKPMIDLTFSNGRSYLEIIQSIADGPLISPPNSQMVMVHGEKAVFTQSRPEPGDNVSKGHTTLRWQAGGWHFLINWEGIVPADELISIAES